MYIFNLRLLMLCVFILTISIIPLPAAFTGIRPAWILLLVLFLQHEMPYYFKYSIIFALGLCLDVLHGSVLGQHVFALVVTTSVAAKMVRRFIFFPIGQQWGLIGLYCVLYQLIMICIDGFLGFQYQFYQCIFSALLTLLFWQGMVIMGSRWMHVQKPVTELRKH